MENKKEKDIAKHKVMSEFLEDRVLIESHNVFTILPSKEYIDFHYYENGKVQILKTSFTQIVDLFKVKQK